jgi:hypothetical protein
MGSGGLFLDYDNDGWIDVFLVDGGSLADRQVDARARHRLFHNRGNGTFEDLTAGSGLVRRGYGMGACAGDYDNDGWTDIYVTGVGGNALYKNGGRGRFADVTAAARVGAASWSTSCAFADVDRDGDLDLLVVNYLNAGVANNKFCGDATRRVRVYCHPNNYDPLPLLLYRNNGDGTFSDASGESGLGKYRGNGLGIAVADYDDDGWPDVFIANDSVPNFLFHNRGNGTFEEVGLRAGVAVANDGKPRAGMGTDFGDYDGDGRLDLIVTNHEFETHNIFRNLGKGLFEDRTAATGLGPPTLPHVGFGAAFLDYDNDARLDLAIVNGHVVDNTQLFRAGSTYAQRKLLFHNEGSGRLAEVGRESGAGFASETVGRGLAVGDIDNDGDLDLLVTNSGQPVELLRNDGAGAGHAVVIRAIGTRSNRDGIGARIRVTAGGVTQLRDVKSGSSYLSQNDLRAHIGLGAAALIDRVEIRWPSGMVDAAERVPADAVLTLTEGKGMTKRAAFAR